MWRLWTNGWFLSGWWYWVKDITPMKIAWWLPRKIAYWAFIRVYAFGVDSPSREFAQICDAWEKKVRPF